MQVTLNLIKRLLNSNGERAFQSFFSLHSLFESYHLDIQVFVEKSKFSLTVFAVMYSIE